MMGDLQGAEEQKNQRLPWLKKAENLLQVPASNGKFFF